MGNLGRWGEKYALRTNYLPPGKNNVQDFTDWFDDYDQVYLIDLIYVANKNYTNILKCSHIECCLACIEQCWGPFLESPESLRAHFGWHNSVGIFKTKASRGTKLCSYFIYSLYNIWKDQLYRISGSEFYEWLFGHEDLSGLPRNGVLMIGNLEKATANGLLRFLFSFPTSLVNRRDSSFLFLMLCRKWDLLPPFLSREKIFCWKQKLYK